ncbi:MAG: Ig-like domain-containing protein [Steroidobacteraceae bacterium]|nr:Ig-like domain-containing protein [Steroidobacteraceae bacterium]
MGMQGERPPLVRAAGIALLTIAFVLAACSKPPQVATGGIAVSGANPPLTALGQTRQLTATALDRDGRPIPGVEFTWSTSNPAVATVNGSGLVTARGNGTATISVHGNNNLRGRTGIEVEQVVVALAISPGDWPAGASWIGVRRQFSAAATDANGFPVQDAAVTWSSSDAGVIAVDGVGLATAMNSGSNVVVSAQSGMASDFVTASIPADVADRPGYMYTIFFGRTDIAPALIVNGVLRVPDDVLGSVSYEDPHAPWPHTLPGQSVTRNTVHKFQWEGNRIGLLTDMAGGAGTFRVIDRVGEWRNLVIATATDFQLEGNRIGVSREGGEFRVKDGIGGTWTVLVTGGTQAFRLEGNRIGVLLEGGEFRVKDGIGGAWTVLVAAGATEFQLAGDRIGVLHDDGTFRVKDGIAGPWTVLAGDAAGFRLRGNRIALLQADGTFRVKDGISGAWTVLATDPIRQYELEGNRIGVLFESGVFQVKDGISGAWTQLASSGVREFQLQGNRIGILRDDGVLRIKSGIFGEWDNTPAYGAGVTQFRLKVDVPVPPYRTTPALYSQKQQQCIDFDDATDNDCYHVSAFAVPVPYYGWYCGQGRPAEFQDIIRNTNLILDSFDAICRHHDTVGAWYPGAGGFGSGDMFASCIVRYGLRHGRLTRDGGLLANGYSDQSTWDNAWSGAGMFNLKDAMDNYFTYTAGCNESNLADFDAEYRSHP